MFALLALLTLLAELLLGYRDRLVKAIGHPVIWIGSLIGVLERGLNRPAWSETARRAAGVVALVLIIAVPVAIVWIAVSLIGFVPLGIVIAAILGSSLIAQRSLAAHVKAVADALDYQGLHSGRRAVSQIVGRDPDRLDEAGVSRAAIESLAENFSDGIVAPTFWLAMGGLPAAVAYKAANTADSMIGHKNERYGAFGWAAARFDDLINLPASRLTALLIVCAALLVPGADTRGAWRAVWRDAHFHRSPNAGWPEAAMAGALGISLAGPRHYGGVLTTDPEMGRGGRRAVTAADIRAALRLYWVADGLLIALLAAVSLLLMLHG